jgi:hypothetical protein
VGAEVNIHFRQECNQETAVEIRKAQNTAQSTANLVFSSARSWANLIKLVNGNFTIQLLKAALQNQNG